MLVGPSEQDLVGRQTKEIIDGLALLTEPVQLGMKFGVDLGKKTSADDLPDESKGEMFNPLEDI